MTGWNCPGGNWWEGIVREGNVREGIDRGRKTFTHIEIENRKQRILEESRKKLIELAIEEKDMELSQANEQFNNMKEEYINTISSHDNFFGKLEKLMNALSHRLNNNVNKKVAFHLGHQQPRVEFVKKKVQLKKKRKWTADRKKKNRIIYRRKMKTRKQKKTTAIVNRIKQENTVINLSAEEVPDAAYIFLAKGLGYVPSQKVDLQDLKYDTTEFVRKLEWKSFFIANPELDTGIDPSGNIHRDIKVSGFTHPSYTSPLLEEVKTKRKKMVDGQD